MEYIGEISVSVKAVSTEEAKEKIMKMLKNENFVESSLNVRGNTDRLLALKGYVIVSQYREKALIALESAGVNGMMPSQIANECDILQNHISKILKDLMDKNLIQCVNPEAKKGRIYRLTNLGKKVGRLI